VLHNSVPRFRAQYAADASCVGVIRGEVTAVARELGIQGEELGDVALAVSEAATNAVVHGSAGRDDPHVRLRVDVGDLEMLVTISDEGDGLKPRLRMVDGTRTGAGLAIIAAVTGRLDVQTGSEGTDVRLTFPCSVPATQARGSLTQLKEATNHVHDSAAQRLEEALTEEDRLGMSFDAAIGTSTEFGAYVRLQRASEQVAARQTWLNWVDNESYRGINAGPFELAADRHHGATAAVMPTEAARRAAQRSRVHVRH
jgi:anti-sigma regulatory factor (Ser/Thr protein kinase)